MILFLLCLSILHKNPVMHQARKACSLVSIKKVFRSLKQPFHIFYKIFKWLQSGFFFNIYIKYVGKQFLTVWNSGFLVDLGPIAFLTYLQNIFLY